MSDSRRIASPDSAALRPSSLAGDLQRSSGTAQGHDTPDPRDATRRGVIGPALPGRESPLALGHDTPDPRDATRGAVIGPALPGRESPLALGHDTPDPRDATRQGHDTPDPRDATREAVIGALPGRESPLAQGHDTPDPRDATRGGVNGPALPVQRGRESPLSIDVSVILPFGDDEEAVGVAVRRTADYLRAAGLRFEIFAIDEDSGDNSHAVLALLRADVPELRVTHASGRGRGVDVGAARAQGTVLVVTTPEVASASLDGVGDACDRLIRGQGDAEIALARYTVARRVRSLLAFRGGRLVGPAMHRQLAKRMQDKDLNVAVAPTAGVANRTTAARIRAFAARAARPL